MQPTRLFALLVHLDFDQNCPFPILLVATVDEV
ncbi:hypothetical protein MPLSOD_140029 [Mesorhizobium sp. SOD10]|nr:hypothetical protein MPLSOD_140029 [Mesorhizobium sp. SOD10]